MRDRELIAEAGRRLRSAREDLAVTERLLALTKVWQDLSHLLGLFPWRPGCVGETPALVRGQIDPEAFDKMRGTAPVPFELGEHSRIAVKVIACRGNEVVRVANLQEEDAYHA